MTDRATLDVYDARAADYADMVKKPEPNRHLTDFIDALPKGARVLDLGCGPGGSAAEMQKAGLRVDAWDASDEMAKLGKAIGVNIRVAGFDALTAQSAYDGIYANFSLLHAPKADMQGHLARIASALRPGGLFHIGMKTGTGEKRDTIGRFYAYYTDAELTGLLAENGLTVLSRETGMDSGLDGVKAPWIIMRARLND